MNTPICDFLQSYARKDVLRLHMPGHKGAGPLGFERLDITEIDGADSLYEASGIIAESEGNASALFGCPTYYSTEGSSLAIRAMLYLALLYGRAKGCAPRVLAGRNAHKTFLSAAALLDLDVEWLWGAQNASYLSCMLSPADLATHLESMPEKPLAIYITSPDYLGNMADIAGIAQVCRQHGVLLLVDSAHGAYLRFLPESLHPMDLGADMCCASAHKTLPVVTGGAYLHISADMPEFLAGQAKDALALFGSTSPSYLLLASLDAANRRLVQDYRAELAKFLSCAKAFRAELQAHGFTLCGDEALKITLAARPWGYTGVELAGILRKAGIEIEFADPDFLVMMLTPEVGMDGLARIRRALWNVPQRPAIETAAPECGRPERVLRIRDALFSMSELLPAKRCAGRVLAAANVGCPPAVPIVVCGERIDAQAISCFQYYGIENCRVVKDR